MVLLIHNPGQILGRSKGSRIRVDGTQLDFWEEECLLLEEACFETAPVPAPQSKSVVLHDGGGQAAVTNQKDRFCQSSLVGPNNALAKAVPLLALQPGPNPVRPQWKPPSYEQKGPGRPYKKMHGTALP